MIGLFTYYKFYEIILISSNSKENVDNEEKESKKDLGN